MGNYLITLLVFLIVSCTGIQIFVEHMFTKNIMGYVGLSVMFIGIIGVFAVLFLLMKELRQRALRR